MAIDDRGHLFSSSFYQERLVEFAANGQYVRTIVEGEQSIPRSISFLPVSGIGDANDDGAVDLIDWAAWVACTTGRGAAELSPNCAVFNFDANLDVDHPDLAGLPHLVIAP